MFAKRLRVRMAEKSMTCKELARSSGISVNTLSSYRIGASSPSFKNLKRLARVLEVDLNYFDKGGADD